MHKRKYILFFFISILIIVSSSCTVVSTSSHTPLEWVTLANSGLSGRDNYTYHAQIETGVYNNIKLNMASFNGEVRSHHEYTISGEDIDATLLHPAKYMDIINQEGNQIQFVNESLGQVTNTTMRVLVSEGDESATSRWKTLIQQQFAQVKLSAENQEQELSAEQYEKSKQLLQQSEQKLNVMLAGLNVQSSFVLTIDTVNAIPLEIEEHAVLTYTKDGKPFSEYRNSNVSLQY